MDRLQYGREQRQRQNLAIASKARLMTSFAGRGNGRKQPSAEDALGGDVAGFGGRDRSGGRPDCAACSASRRSSSAPGAPREREQDDITENQAREALIQLDPLWDELFPAEQARIVQLLVERVDVRMHGVEVRLRPNGLAGLVREVAGSRRAAA